MHDIRRHGQTVDRRETAGHVVPEGEFTEVIWVFDLSHSTRLAILIAGLQCYPKRYPALLPDLQPTRERVSDLR